MAPGSGNLRRLAASFVQPSSTLESFVCSSCRQTPSFVRQNRLQPTARRSYAISASAPASQPTETSTSQLTPPTETANPQPQYLIRAGVLLSRPPVLTASLSPFESAFYFYQRRLNERLVLPFSQYFYFKRGTPAYEDWKNRRRERGGVAARDVGTYNAYGEEAWNDEILVDSQESNPEGIVQKLVEEEGREKFPSPEELKDLSKPLHGLRRITEADRKNDTRSLERALSKTLYLLIKKQKPGQKQGEGFWQFPSGAVQGTEGLREAAERTLEASCGPNMNTWFVANHPVGHFIYNYQTAKASSEDQASKLGEKTFFIKSRIMAGQADIAANSMDILDYQWLAKDEIEKVVAPQYWKSVKNMLAER